MSENLLYTLQFLSLLGLLGLMIDRYWLQPHRNEVAIEAALKDFEAKIPEDKFMYIKTKCPDCGKDLT